MANECVIGNNTSYNDTSYRLSKAECMGYSKNKTQDRLFYKSDEQLIFVAVLDGHTPDEYFHGEYYPVEICMFLERYFADDGLENFKKKWQSMRIKALEELFKECRECIDVRQDIIGGSTMHFTVVDLVYKEICVVYLGDSFTFVLGKHRETKGSWMTVIEDVMCTKPHSPECPEEQQRIRDLGLEHIIVKKNSEMRIVCGKYILGSTASIGDHYCKSVNGVVWTRQEPSVAIMPLYDGDRIIICSDGVIDTLCIVDKKMRIEKRLEIRSEDILRCVQTTPSNVEAAQYILDEQIKQCNEVFRQSSMRSIKMEDYMDNRVILVINTI